jgi:hypothetical protein
MAEIIGRTLALLLIQFMFSLPRAVKSIKIISNLDCYTNRHKISR